MFESLIGLILLIGSGLVGREVLLREQPALKPTLHHLDVYRDAIGMALALLSVGGLYHSVSTSLSHEYTPIYWCFWSISNLCGFTLGVALSFDTWDPYFSSHYPRIHQIGLLICGAVNTRLTLLCWSGLALGCWRTLHPWVG